MQAFENVYCGDPNQEVTVRALRQELQPMRGSHLVGLESRSEGPDEEGRGRTLFLTVAPGARGSLALPFLSLKPLLREYRHPEDVWVRDPDLCSVLDWLVEQARLGKIEAKDVLAEVRDWELKGRPRFWSAAPER